MIRVQRLQLDLHGTKPCNLPVTANVWNAKFSTVNAPSNWSSTNGINMYLYIKPKLVIFIFPCVYRHN